MILRDLIVAVEMVTRNDNASEVMAVPKKRRSKAKGKTRLSNWKKKAVKAANKAYSAAKTVFAKEKKAAASLKNSEKTINSSDSTNETND